MSPRRLLAFSLLTLLAVMPSHAADWPGWRGADRTGVSTETGLLKQWPEGGPALLWKATDLGSGYSTPSVAGGRIYVVGTGGRDEFVLALDAKNGKEVWSGKIGSMARVSYPGPRCTPTIDGERLYALGSDGDLVCLETATGKRVWRKQLLNDFGGAYGMWAYAESPLIDGDLLICTPGGARATLLALNKKTGEVVWKSPISGKNTAGYASPIVAEVGGMRQYVQFLSGGVVGVAAKDGKLLWRYDKTAGRGTNCTTPIFHDNCVFSSASYGVGSGMVRLSADGDGIAAKEVFFTRSLANHHGGVVRVGDCLYGTSDSALVCLDFKTGDKKWSDRAAGKGAVSAADGMLYVRGERGTVVLAEATPEGYKERGRFEQPSRSRESAWPHPVIAGGRLYLRDQDVLLCYDVKGEK